MKLQASNLISFLKKASVGGTIPTMLLDFRKDGVVCKIRSKDNICLSSSILKSTAFSEYEDGIQWYIKDASALLKKLAMLSGAEIVVSQQENMMVFSANKDGRVVTLTDGMSSSDVVDNVMSDEDIDGIFNKFDGGSVIDKKTISAWNTAINTMGTTKTAIVVKDKKLFLKNPNDNKEEASISIDFDYKDCSTKMNANILQSALQNMSDNSITMAVMRDNAPIMIKETTENMTIRVVQAPIVEDEDEKEEKKEKKTEKKEEKKEE